MTKYATVSWALLAWEEVNAWGCQAWEWWCPHRPAPKVIEIQSCWKEQMDKVRETREWMHTPECLSELKRFVDNAFAFFVIAYFSISLWRKSDEFDRRKDSYSERKVFAQGVTFETIVGEDATAFVINERVDHTRTQRLTDRDGQWIWFQRDPKLRAHTWYRVSWYKAGTKREIPISTTENLDGARDGVCLSSIGLNPDATAVPDAQ